MREALASLTSSTTKTLTSLHFNPISLVDLVALRWHGLAAFGDAGWVETRFWGGLRGLGVGIYAPWSVSVEQWEEEEEEEGCGGGKGERKAEDGHVRMGMKILHDWLGSFAEALEVLTFEWVAMPTLTRASVEDGDHTEEQERLVHTGLSLGLSSGIGDIWTDDQERLDSNHLGGGLQTRYQSLIGSYDHQNQNHHLYLSTLPITVKTSAIPTEAVSRFRERDLKIIRP